MRRDGLRIDPKARPYGMQAFDLIAELVGGMKLVTSRPIEPHGRALLAALGVELDLIAAPSVARGSSLSTLRTSRLSCQKGAE